VENVAGKIKDITKDEYPKNPEKKIGNKRDCIKKWLELTNKDNRLIDAYVEILNQEGGYACISQEKYFRLTKNIGIEIAFFLLSTYEEKFEKPYNTSS